MSLPALVLVHGGGLAADSWDLTIEQIERLAPELTVLAIDLPGRRNKPGDLRTATIADFVDSVIADIDDADVGDIVIVAHSFAGLTVPGVVAKLGRSRVREMVMAAAFVPPEGATMIDTVPFKRVARRGVRRNRPSVTPKWLVRFAYLNGVPRARRRFMAGKLHSESIAVMAEKVSRRGMPVDIPRTWIFTLRDRALRPKLQRAPTSGHSVGCTPSSRWTPATA
ncbi:alpha/beta fold hydrolase [Mycolicibacterium septicum]|uniref:alpha/beta fold hydrolase n=1 Tax=Mycolicibacterium septicum TaxID=98668 RepID=UPI000414880E|nr:alpha/beta hydrolase [Mycolicibacterium septicum]